MENEKFTVSVSSAKTFSDCQMQWYIGSVLKIRKPDTPATRIGTVFAELTEHLANGDLEKANEIISNEENTTVKMLYDKNAQFLANLKNEVSKAEFELAFGINLYISYSGWIDAVIETEEKIILRDYKTAKDFSYSLTEKNLGVDEQLNIYGYFIQTYYNPKNKPIWLEHQQFHKGTGMRREVRVPYSHEEGKAIYDWIVEQAELMVEGKRKGVEEVEKNFDSCGKFGGCAYVNYCKGRINLEELEDVLNPNVKKRSKEELIQMKPEERLSELKAEQDFNKKGNEVLTKINLKKGDEGMDIKQRLMAIKAKQEEAKKNGAFVEPAKVGTIIEDKEFPVGFGEKEAQVKNIGVVESVIMTSTPAKVVTPVEEKKTRTRRTKAEMAKVIDPNTFQEPIEHEMAGVSVQMERLPKQVLVLVGCAFLEEDKNNPSDFLHDKYIAPILKQENIPHISCSEFSKANKSVMLFAQSILDEIYNGYESINIDIRRPVDALVYTMIMDLDTKRNGKRFKLIRSTF